MADLVVGFTSGLRRKAARFCSGPVKPDPGNREIARIGNRSERWCRPLHLRLLMEPKLMDCCPDYSGGEAIATYAAADRRVSSICEVREAKER